MSNDAADHAIATMRHVQDVLEQSRRQEIASLDQMIEAVKTMNRDFERMAREMRAMTQEIRGAR